MTTTSYWLAEPFELKTKRTSSPVDVTIVGAGVTGCSCALALAERGLRVRVHEARRVAAGASGRNGGFALRGAAMPYDRAQAQFGPERARLLWQLTESALVRLRSLAGDAFRLVGSLRLAADEAEREQLARELAALREDGFAAEWLEELPPPLCASYRGAILHPGDGALDPARWVRRLAERACRAGAEIVEESSVVPADLEPPVVLAADGLLAAGVRELEPHVWPERGQMLATEPLPERLYGRPHYARNGFDYWQQLPDGTLIVGGKRDADFESERTAEEATTPVIQGRLDELVTQLVGRLPRVTHRWAGIWGQTPDRLPLVGRVGEREGLWVAGGYSGHGNVLGLACGELVARAIVGERPRELALFEPGRFA